MKRSLWTVFVTALVALALGGVFAIRTGQAQGEQQSQVEGGEPARSITVSGTGRASAQPDMAAVQIGVQTEAESAQEALSQNNEQVQVLIDALREAGIAQADIQTLTVQLSPRYEEQQQPGDLELVGYTATNVVEATVRDLENLGQILDAAVESGANLIQGIRFDISDSSEQLSQAREAAVSDARGKAEQLASLVDAELGEILTISETTQVPIPFGSGGAIAAEQAAVPIEPGTQTFTVNLQITWILTSGQ